MPRGGHNQTNFIQGVRQTGPNSEGHFNSACILDNYDVLSSGHIKRRNGLRKLFPLPIGLSNESFKQILAFGDFLILLSDSGNIYCVWQEGEEIPTSYHGQIRCIPFSVRWHVFAASGQPTRNPAKLLDGVLQTGLKLVKPLTIFKLEKIDSKHIWAYSDKYFAPFVLELQGNRITSYPFYMQDKETHNIYPFLRSIPLKINKPIFSPIVSSDFDDTKRVRLFVDKDSDLNKHNACKIWLGINNITAAEKGNIHYDINKVNLSDYLKKPLFFNILPTEEVTIDPNKNYDSDDDFSGSGVSAVLTRLNARVDKLSGVEMSGELKRAFIKEVLFGRKYCVIPYEIKDERTDKTDFSHTSLFPSTINAKSAVTTAKFNMEAIDDELSVETAIPDTAKIKLTPVDISGDDYKEGGSEPITGNIVMDFDTSNVKFEVSYESGGITVSLSLSSDKVKINGVDDTSLFESVYFYVEYTYNDRKSSRRYQGTTKYIRFKSLLSSGEYDEEGLTNHLNLRLKNRSLSEILSALDSVDFNSYEDKDRSIRVALTLKPNVFAAFDSLSFRIDNNILSGQYRRSNDVIGGYLTGTVIRGGFPTFVGRLTFYNGSTLVRPNNVKPTEGVQVFGYEPPKGNLNVEFNDAIGIERDFLPSEAFADNTFYRKLTKMGITLDHSASSDKYGVLVESRNNLSSDLNGVNNITLGSKTKSLGNWVHNFDGTNHIHKSKIIGSNQNEVFDIAKTGNKNDLDFKKGSAAQFRMFKMVAVTVIPAYGWSRNVYFYDPDLGDTRKDIRSGGSVADGQVLTDNQGLLALGYHMQTSINKITPFVLVDKNAVIASETTCTMVIDGVTYNLVKKDVEDSDLVQEFRLDDSSADFLSSFPSFAGAKSVSLTFGTTVYNFELAIPEQTGAAVYANCFIFEVGMASPDIKARTGIAGGRFIGGNNYEANHAVAGEVLEGTIEGLDHATAIGSDDVWTIIGDEIHRMSKNKSLFSNNYIRRLTQRGSKDYVDTLALSGESIFNIANTADETDKTLRSLNKFITIKNLKLKEHEDYPAIEAYLTADHLGDQQAVGNQIVSRNYNASLIDPSGDSLLVKTMTSNFSNLGLFIGTNKGVFIINSTDLVPSLLSRQVIKDRSNFIALNNKLVFLNENNELMDLKFSDERKGYVEDKVGRYQTFLYKNVQRLLYLNDSIYGISKETNPERTRIIRAIVELKTILGFSTYSFKELEDIEQFNKNRIPIDRIKPELLFVDKNNQLGILYRPINYMEVVNNVETFRGMSNVDLIEVKPDYHLASFSEQDTGWDEVKCDKFRNNDEDDLYFWTSVMGSNAMIFNNLVGMIGAVVLAQPIRGLSIFEQRVKRLFISAGPDCRSNTIWIDYIGLGNDHVVSVENIFQPIVELEGITGHRMNLLFVHNNRPQGGEPYEKTFDNYGEIHGFQALIRAPDPQGRAQGG